MFSKKLYLNLHKKILYTYFTSIVNIYKKEGINCEK